MTDYITTLAVMQSQYSHIRQSDAEWEAIEAAKDALAQLAALQVENGLKDKEMERLKDTVEAYAASARSIALWLNAYCDKSLTYDKMISDAAHKAASALSRVEAERDAAYEHICDQCDILPCLEEGCNWWRCAQGVE